MSEETRDGPCVRHAGLRREPHTAVSLVLSPADQQGLLTSRRQAGEHFPLREGEGERRSANTCDSKSLLYPSYSCVMTEGLTMAESGFLVYTGIFLLKKELD